MARKPQPQIVEVFRVIGGKPELLSSVRSVKDIDAIRGDVAASGGTYRLFVNGILLDGGLKEFEEKYGHQPQG